MIILCNSCEKILREGDDMNIMVSMAQLYIYSFLNKSINWSDS